VQACRYPRYTDRARCVTGLSWISTGYDGGRDHAPAALCLTRNVGDSTMKAGAPIRRILTFLTVFTVTAFAVVVIRETAAVVALARDLHPVAGQVALWILVAVYCICLGVPLFLFVRLPKPLVPPASDTDPAFPGHLSNLRRRLSRNTHLRGVTITPDRASIQAALDLLEIRADQEIRKEASLVFLSTAISQSGRLDGLFVLVAQTRLVWKVAHIYRQRASARELLHLYANVAATVFAAESARGLDCRGGGAAHGTAARAAGVGVTVVLAPVARCSLIPCFKAP